MSIIIKGMDMPKTCEDCGFDFIGCDLFKQTNAHEYRHSNCPLIEIPTPHGRLIDADVLREECYKMMDKLMESTSEHLSMEALSLLCGFSLINDAPTILVEEKE